MPKRDQHGNAVMIACAADLNPDKFHHNDALKTWFMLQDVFLLENGTVPGFVVLVDSKGFGLGHLRKMNIQTMKKYCMYTQVCSVTSPLFTLLNKRYKCIHYDEV